MKINNPHNIKVGLSVFDYNLKEYKVVSVGNKYFTCESVRNKVDLLTLRTVTQYQPLKLYIDKESPIKEKRVAELYQKIKSHFNTGYTPKNSLEELEAIALVLFPKRKTD